MNKKYLLEAALMVLVGSGLTMLAKQRFENEFRNAICDSYNEIMYVMKPIAESIRTLEQRPQENIEQPKLYLVDSRKY